MKQLLLFLSLLPLPCFAKSAGFSDSTAVDTAVITELIRERFPGSELLSFEQGDLNRDGTTDLVAVVTRACNPEEAELEIDRPVECRRIILLIRENNNYKLATWNDYVADCSVCGGGGIGDAFRGMEIGDGMLSVFNAYGACDRVETTKIFRYDAAHTDWFLEELVSDRVNCNVRAADGGIDVLQTVTTRDHFGQIRFRDYGVEVELPFSEIYVAETLFVPPTITERIQQFVDSLYPGSVLIQLERGDLNLDGTADVAAIVTRPCDQDELSIRVENIECRRLLVLLNDGTEQFRVAAVNDNVIDCSACGGGFAYHDALAQFTATEGELTITSTYGACERELYTHVYTFVPEKDNWFLSEEIHYRYNHCNPEEQEGVTTTETVKDFGWVWLGR